MVIVVMGCGENMPGSKKLIDIIDEMNMKESTILDKFNKLIKLILSFNPSIDNVELRWVEERINRFNSGKQLTKQDLKTANTIWKKWNKQGVK